MTNVKGKAAAIAKQNEQNKVEAAKETKRLKETKFHKKY